MASEPDIVVNTISANGLHLLKTKPLLEQMLTFLTIGPIRNKLSQIQIKIQTFSFKKMHLKMLCEKCQSFFSGLKVRTLRVLKPEYSDMSRLIPWLLMSWYLSHVLFMTKMSDSPLGYEEQTLLKFEWKHFSFSNMSKTLIKFLLFVQRPIR